MLVGLVPNPSVQVLLWVFMGLGMAGVGLTIMHDADHGSYSKNQKVNKILGMTINFAGGYALNWKIQHNVLHHTYTNVNDLDQDIDTGKLMRFSPRQPHFKFQKFQIHANKDFSKHFKTKTKYDHLSSYGCKILTANVQSIEFE